MSEAWSYSDMREHERQASLDERVIRIERKLNAVLRGLHYLITRESDMSKIHDDLDALASGVDAAADRVIAAKTEGEASLADVISKFASVRDKLNAAADDAGAVNDNAASGSSTGSGAGTLRVDDSAGRSGSTLTDKTGGSSSS